MTKFSAADILNVFTLQSGYCRDLGSPFMGDALLIVRDLLAPGDTPLAETILNWPGDPRTNADSVALRVMGGLHALVLTDQDRQLAAEYPPNTAGDLKAALNDAIRNHANFLIDWIKHAPQTNETARQSPLIAAASLLTQKYNLPIHLIELGASAGLNLRWTHTAIQTVKGHFGCTAPALTLTPDWQGDLPPATAFEIASAQGADLNPLDPTDPDQALRLLAYLWPDQPDRLARARAAIQLANDFPIKVAKADAIDWLETTLAKRAARGLTLIYHTIAWQYFPTAHQTRGKALIEATGKTATKDAPLAWLSMEADDETPGAGLTLRLWPGDHTIPLGRADFHGRWVRWDVGQTLPI